MRLSEMNGDQLATCLCIVTEPAEKIAEDDEVVGVIRGCMTTREVDGKAVNYMDIPRAVFRLIPILLRKFRRETFTILGAMNGKTADEIAEQNGLKTIADIKAVFDSDLLAFFTSFRSAE